MGEIFQDSNRKVTVKVKEHCFSLYYGLFTFLEFGMIEDEDLQTHLLEIKKLLVEKYGESNFRVKFLTLILLKNETHEMDTQDREWVRYILHAECEPEDSHHSLMEELEELINEGIYLKKR